MKLSTPTQMLFQVAMNIEVLTHVMGIDGYRSGPIMKLREIPRHYLVREGQGEHMRLTFDPDLFAERLGTASSGERHAILFLLNVWNPGYAKEKGWHFDLFDAVGTLGCDNIIGITKWMENPVWP